MGHKNNITCFRLGWIFLGIVLLSLSFINALDDVDIRVYSKVGKNLTLTESCSYNGIMCPSTFICNITISNKNGAILENKAMNRSLNIYYYNVSSIYTNNLDVYECVVYCYNTTVGGKNTFYYEITRTGRKNVSGGMTIFFYGLVIFVFIGYFFFVTYNLAYFFNWKWKDSKLKDLYMINDFLFNWGGFFLLVFFTYLFNYFIGHELINTILMTMIWISVLMNLILSVVAIIITFSFYGINSTLNFKKDMEKAYGGKRLKW